MYTKYLLVKYLPKPKSQRNQQSSKSRIKIGCWRKRYEEYRKRNKKKNGKKRASAEAICFQ